MSSLEIYKKLILDEMEKNGVIDQIKAKIKYNVIEVIKNKDKETKQKLEFDFLTPFQKQSKKSDKLMLLSHLILEFLQFFEMEYTLPIFQNETNIKETISKETLIKDSYLNIGYEKDQPILLQVFNSYIDEKKNKKRPTFDDNFYKKDKEIPIQSIGLNVNQAQFLNPIQNASSSSSISNPTTAQNISSSEMVNLNKIKKLAPLSFGGQTQVEEKEIEMKDESNEYKKQDEKISPFAMLLNKSKEVDKFNNTDVYQDTHNENQENSQERVNVASSLDSGNMKNSKNNVYLENMIDNQNRNDYNLSDDDIKEEIYYDNSYHDNQNEINEKEDKSEIYNYTSSQTYGYDNSVVSNNFEGYDYVESVEKPY